MSPFFRWCRCLRKKKSASQGHSHNLLAATAIATTTDSATLVCHACKRSISRSDCHFHIQHLPRTRRYHIGCLVCFHCHALVNPQREEFCYCKSKNKKRGGTTRMREQARQPRGREEVNTNTDNEADSKESRRRISYPEDDDEHPFHRACYAHHFGWLCVVCEKPLPIVTTKIIDDSSHDTATRNTGNKAAVNSNTISFTHTAAAAAAAGSTDTTTFPSGNQNAFDETVMVDNSSPGVTCSNQNVKPRKITKVEFIKHPFFSNERICPHHVKTVVTSDILMLQQQHRHQCVEVDYFYPSRVGGSEGEENLLISVGSSSMDTSATEIGESESKTIRRCAGCHRFEPMSPAKHFANVGDQKSGQCLCLACCRTVVTSSDDVIPLWDRVSSFTWKTKSYVIGLESNLVCRAFSLRSTIMNLFHEFALTCRLLISSRDHWV